MIFLRNLKKNRPVSETWKFLSLAVFVSPRKRQAMPVLIHSARRGENPVVIFPSALLVEGSAPKPPLNAEFHSAAARSANAYDQDQLTAGRGLFLFRRHVPPPYSEHGPRWIWPLKAPSFPRGSADTRRRFSSFPPAVWRTRLAAP